MPTIVTIGIMSWGLIYLLLPVNMRIKGMFWKRVLKRAAIAMIVIPLIGTIFVIIGLLGLTILAPIIYSIFLEWPITINF